VPPPARETSGREHRYDIDLLRLIASCAVIFEHTCATLIKAVGREESNGPGAYWVGLTGDSLVSFSVPVFFAIGGWVVLSGAPPKDSSRLWRRLERNLVPVFVWSALYLAWAWLRGTNDMPMPELARNALFGSVEPAYHLWFMYNYIPVVALLSAAVLIRAGHRPWGVGLVLLAVAGAPTAMSTFRELTDWETPPLEWGFGTYQVIYAVGGALLLSLPHRVAARHRWVLVPLTAAFMAACLWYNAEIHYVIPNAHLFVAGLTICVLLLLNRVHVPERWRPALTRLANAALGAYLVHVFFVEELVRPLVSPDLGALNSALLMAVMIPVVTALAYGVSLLWARLGLGRWLG
jgi:surface polysaccharide O-acyltransferase-like enzyme